MHTKNKQFIAMVKTSGWSQAEAARQLLITPGAVSQICNGITRPRAGILSQFRMLLEHKNPAAFKGYQGRFSTARAPWAIELVEALFRLPKKDRKNLRKPFMEMIRALRAAGRRRRT